MLSRRNFIKWTMIAGGSLFLPTFQIKTSNAMDFKGWYMPEEGEPHTRTWLAFIASRDIWSRKQIPEVQRNLATIAKTIATYEPVSMLVRKQDMGRAKELIGGPNDHNYPIELIEFDMNDLWIRDTGPIFVVNGKGQKSAVNFNFNGWGEDQDYELDAKVADFVAKKAGVSIVRSSVVMEGGCFEVDGQGTAIMTESCILNDNRNPGKSKKEVEDELKKVLGLRKIIWLKGIKGRDITDGHTDFYARFARPGVLVVSRDSDKSSYDYRVTRENIDILKASTDADGNPFEMIILDTPWDINSTYGTKSFAAGYVGYYACNGAIVMQKFGDKKADRVAREKIAKAFPHHRIEQISIDGIASGGGSIHCATQQEPKA
ncbi:agmatine deiminase family protein [Desulfoluna butyratoxydans]|uniref:Peptidyl-arginine deiminase porphyromonas-type n=1 Tax=Desulfoluna butyratoxydans TaxID=231438 RepID=A0A4U8YT92_9BACT|nr:agmatine deiminase family protein [Desulfoluna butyratoxydans]VFQ44533.1 peptidyl-arginine deiminase porphyromonas-type [Desulfoluna butyratoxydans]